MEKSNSGRERRKFVPAVVLAASSLVLGACSGDSDASSSKENVPVVDRGLRATYIGRITHDTGKSAATVRISEYIFTNDDDEEVHCISMSQISYPKGFSISCESKPIDQQSTDEQSAR